MKVFVLVPIHNRKEITLNFLRSFVNQTYIDYQMVIVDDGSTDGSSDAILAEFSKTTILKGDGNLWWTGSMNMGLEYILSIAQDDDFVLAINDDVVVKNDYIEKIINLSRLESNAIVGSLHIDDENMKIVYDSGVRIDWKRYRYYQVPFNKDKKFTEDVDTLSTRGVLIPINVIKKIGFFEKRLRHYGADYEYFFRAKKNGYKIILSYEAVVYGSEKDKTAKNLSRIQPVSEIWKRNFSIKSAYNIYNHLFLVWYYCPSVKYKIKNFFVLISYDSFLFLNSIFLYPFKYFFSNKIIR